MKHYKILICIPSNIGRSVLPAPFSDSIAENVFNVAKQCPDIDIKINYFGGLRIDAVRNQMVYYAKQLKMDAIIMLDDDMIFPPNALVRLIERWKEGFPIVSGVYGSKSYPYHVFIMPLESKGWSGANWLKEYEPKVYPVKTVATGCILIDMNVFDKIDEPYFLLRMDKFGHITYTEDCYFGMNAHNHAIPMIVDASIQCQHLDMVAFPMFFNKPFVTYGEPMVAKDKEQGQRVVYPMNPKSGKEQWIIDDVHLKEKIIIVHPKEGFFYSDGIDECEHQHQIQIAVNEGESPLYKCTDCGFILNPLTKITDLEKMTNDSPS